MRFVTFLSIFTLVTVGAAEAAPGSAKSQPHGQASVEYAVERSGGGYEVTVSPTFVTVFYLPERVTKAIASNQKDFKITLMQDTVVVKPVSNQIGLTANLNIDTRKLHISVILTIGEPDDAVPQVIFTRAKEKAEIDRKVDEALAPLRAELEEKERAFASRVRESAMASMAEAMARDFVVQELDAIARGDGNVVARVPRAVRIGDAVYVQLAIQNRGGAPFLIKDAVALQDGREVTGSLAFFPRDGQVGKVESGQRGRGVLVVTASALQAGRPFELRLLPEPNGTPLVVPGLRAP